MAEISWQGRRHQACAGAPVTGFRALPLSEVRGLVLRGNRQHLSQSVTRITIGAAEVEISTVFTGAHAPDRPAGLCASSRG